MLPSITTNLIEKVHEIANKLGLRFVDDLALRHRISIFFSSDFPLWLNIDVDEKEEAAFLYVTGRAYGALGDKSDYHDLMSSVFAISFRLSNTSSARTLPIELSDILPGEIYAFYILFDRQPPSTFIDLRQPDFNSIEQILTASYLAALRIIAIWGLADEAADEKQYISEESVGWMLAVSKCLKVKLKSSSVRSWARKNPSWEYFRITNRGLFVAQFDFPVIRLFEVADYTRDLTMLRGVNGQIIDSVGIRNSIPSNIWKTGLRIIKALDMKVQDAVLVPTESYLYLLAGRVIVGIRSECGLESYLEEKARILQRHQFEAKALFSSIAFEWVEKVDDDEFEKLVVELLNREPGVRRARKVGKGREPDDGRDILVEWFRPRRVYTENTPFYLQNIVVQCKAHRRPIGKSNVQDILDLLYSHDARGYLLVAMSGITKPLIDYLEKINKRGEYWVDWWGRIEIEDRLRANRDIANRYTHIIKTIDHT